MALLALVDQRTLVTCATLETIANMAGRSEDRTSKLLTLLKKKKLIRRWPKKPAVQNDPWHYVWYTRIVPEACCESVEDREHLLHSAAMPKTA